MNMDNVKKVNSLGFNQEKTNELISELKEQGLIVGIEDLGAYLRKQGLIVKEHIGRKRSFVEVSPKVYGVDVDQKGQETKDFFKEHIKTGKMSFIPDTYEKKLVNLESSIRMARRRACIGYDEQYMPLDTYHEFVKEFENKKKDYLNIRDEIVARWDMLIQSFKQGLRISLEELGAIDKDTVFTTIVAKLPTKTEYKESFYMTLSAKAFPVTENLDMFEESIQQQIREGLNQDTVSTLYDIIGNTLDDAFENVSKVLSSIQANDKLANKTLGAIKKTAERVAQKNIFHNPMIDEIRQDILSVVASSEDIEEMAEQSENLLAKIYGYARDLGVEASIKSLHSCPLTEEELLSYYSLMEKSPIPAMIPTTPSVVASPDDKSTATYAIKTA